MLVALKINTWSVASVGGQGSTWSVGSARRRVKVAFQRTIKVLTRVDFARNNHF